MPKLLASAILFKFLFIFFLLDVGDSQGLEVEESSLLWLQYNFSLVAGLRGLLTMLGMQKDSLCCFGNTIFFCF